MNPVDRFNELTSLLYTKLFQGNFFFFDLWSLNHLWSGLLVFLVLHYYKCRFPFIKLLILLILYEVFEILLIYFTVHVFKPETIKDQFTDIFVGFMGGVLAFSYGKISTKYIFKSESIPQWHLYIFTSMTLAYAWLVFIKDSVCLTGQYLIVRNLMLYLIEFGWIYILCKFVSNPNFTKQYRKWIFLFVLLFIDIIVNIVIHDNQKLIINNAFTILTSNLKQYKFKILAFPIILLLLPYWLIIFGKLFNDVAGKNSVRNNLY